MSDLQDEDANHVIVDIDGTPLGVMDAIQTQADAKVLAYRIAAVSDDIEEVDRILSEELRRVGNVGFGFIALAALRIVIEHIVDPLLRNSAVLHEAGLLIRDPRTEIIEERDELNAEENDR